MSSFIALKIEVGYSTLQNLYARIVPTYKHKFRSYVVSCETLKTPVTFNTIELGV